MESRTAQWADVLDALVLEAAALGAHVAWDHARVRSWWDTGAMTSRVVRDGGRLVAYASAAHITEDAFERIVAGRLDPEDLVPGDRAPRSTHHWIGIVVCDTERRCEGWGSRVLGELVRDVGGAFVADVYSPEGRRLVERLGWRCVRDTAVPIYVTGDSA